MRTKCLLLVGIFLFLTVISILKWRALSVSGYIGDGSILSERSVLLNRGYEVGFGPITPPFHIKYQIQKLPPLKKDIVFLYRLNPGTPKALLSDKNILVKLKVTQGTRILINIEASIDRWTIEESSVSKSRRMFYMSEKQESSIAVSDLNVQPIEVEFEISAPNGDVQNLGPGMLILSCGGFK